MARGPKSRYYTPIDPSEREQQMIGLAEKLAEQQLRDGTASSQVITHYLKLGTRKSELELEMMRQQKDLMAAKTEAIQSQKHFEELYTEAIEAMRRYGGQRDDRSVNEEEIF